MDFDFKHCEYYEKSMEYEHCPFQKVCRDKCFFTLYDRAEQAEDLVKDLESLASENCSLEEESSRLQNDNDELIEEVDELEEKLEELKSKHCECVHYLKQVLVELSKHQLLPMSPDSLPELMTYVIMLNERAVENSIIDSEIERYDR